MVGNLQDLQTEYRATHALDLNGGIKVGMGVARYGEMNFCNGAHT
jgi:hypothetical protein